MAKKKKTASDNPSKQQKRQAEERARAKEREEQEKRAENARKSRQMGNVFLYAILSLVAVFCLYTLIRTLFFSADSVTELRSNLLFISLVAIPYLIGTVAVVTRKLNKKRRADYSDRGRRLSGLFFVLIMMIACVMFGFQMLRGRTEAAKDPAYTRTLEALESSGMTVSKPEEVYGFNSLLEHSLETDLTCGQTKVLLNYHTEATSWVAKRFYAQTARDYADCPMRETQEGLSHPVFVWGPVEADGSARAAVVALVGSQIRVLELTGPAEELEILIPALIQSTADMLA